VLVVSLINKFSNSNIIGHLLGPAAKKLKLEPGSVEDSSYDSQNSELSAEMPGLRGKTNFSFVHF